MKRMITLLFFLGVAQNAFGAANDETISKWPFLIEVFNGGARYDIAFQYKKKNEQGWTTDIIPRKSKHFLIANEIQPVVRFKAVEKLGVIGTLPTTEFNFLKGEEINRINTYAQLISDDLSDEKTKTIPIGKVRWDMIDGFYRLVLYYPSSYSWKLEGKLTWIEGKDPSLLQDFAVKTALLFPDLKIQNLKIQNIFPIKLGDFMKYDYQGKNQDANAKIVRDQAAIILGVDENADFNVKKKAYLKLAREWHPDKNKSPGAEKVFKLINHAYQIFQKDQ